MSLYDDVYGLTYKSAEEQMNLLSQSILQQVNKGFESLQDLQKWAEDHYLDKVVFSNMSHQFLCISHKGEIMTATAYANYYKDLLFIEERSGNRLIRSSWVPEGFRYYDKAYIVGEQSDGQHRPLYHRSYVTPTGYYCVDRDSFNVAKPFPVFAEETGADTSHIYKYIEHLAGDCAMHLLAWLRAKLLYPTVKTQVVPIIVSRAQGSGKTTFAEVICKGLFGKDNVLVTDQYDSTARFNADYADALIVCQEEKEETDRRNPAGALKSRATATTIRKEQKGIDPIYQASFTDFIMTTNKDVPIKFDGREDQRRFMIMEADESFTRKTSDLADEVFTKLYGFDANYNPSGKPFVDDRELIAQFKHELFTRKDIVEVPLRQFPKTAAYHKCFTLPRTLEAAEVESILLSIAPFIRASLDAKKVVEEVNGQKLSDVVQYVGAVQYMPAFRDFTAYVALCRPLVFYELMSNKALPHSVVERGIYDCAPKLLADYGIVVVPDMDALPGGFTSVAGRYRSAAAARFALDTDMKKKPINIPLTEVYDAAVDSREGKRFRVNKKFMPDEDGCFETVNELKEGVKNLKDKTKNVKYMDTFLLESDVPNAIQRMQEEKIASEWISKWGEGAEIKASVLYKSRLNTALTEAMRLFDEGIVARIVYSGAKSYHLLIRISDAPDTLEEYKWIHGYLCNNLSNVLVFDESTADPARLTRSPIVLDRSTSAYGLLVCGRQQLIKEDWKHVFGLDWRKMFEQWKNRPLNKFELEFGKQLYPCRKEYRVAMEAIVTGSFWSDTKYNGDRQRLFFPAYRLLRVLGYSHERLWADVIPRGLRGYKKQNEISYWLSRKDSVLISKIDEEIDAYEEQMSGQ